MAEIVNLRTLRKQKEREAAKARGIGASAKSGRSRALKALEKVNADKSRRALDGHQKE